MRISDFVRKETTVRGAAVLTTGISSAALMCRLLDVKIEYDSRSPAATPVLTLLIAVVVLVGAASLSYFA